MHARVACKVPPAACEASEQTVSDDVRRYLEGLSQAAAAVALCAVGMHGHLQLTGAAI